MHTIADIGSKRLEKVLVKDKTENPNKVVEILRSEVFELLSCYMDVEDLNISCNVETEGYTFKLQAKASRIKSFGILPN